MNKRRTKGFTLIEIAVVITLVGILAFAAAPRFLDLKANADEACAHELLNSLKTSSMFYIAEEHKSPSCFNDFIIIDGNLTGSKTLNLHNLANNTEAITLNNDSKELSVKFISGVSAIYYLDGSNVTADISI